MNKITIKARMSASETQVELPVFLHVHDRVERFNFKQEINSKDVPISYISTGVLDSSRDINIANMSHLIPQASGLLFDERFSINSFTSNSYLGSFKDYLFTNITIQTSTGEIRPLWYKHKIVKPVDGRSVINVSLTKVVNGHNMALFENYIIDLSTGCVYTDFMNTFDEQNNLYTIYVVQATLDDNTVIKEILNVKSAISEATWEDIDVNTGFLTTAYPTYSKTQYVDYWKFEFSITNTYFAKPFETSFFNINSIQGRSGDEPWKAVINNGDLFLIGVDGILRHYWLPEYYTVSYAPYLPYQKTNKFRLQYIDSNYLYAKNLNLALNLSSFDIHVYDQLDQLVYLYTTDTTKVGTIYENKTYQLITSFNYSSDGFLLLDIPINVAFKYYLVNGTYSSEKYICNQIDLNPVQNHLVQDYMYFFYIIPNRPMNEQALHYLRVDSTGLIVDTSQGSGFTYPNFKLTDGLGGYNPDTVIGKRFISNYGPGFLANYCCVANNNYQYLPVAMVSLNKAQEEVTAIDCTRDLYAITEEAKNANRQALVSIVGHGVRGIDYDDNQVTVVQVPVNLLISYNNEECGGTFTAEQVEDLLTQFYPATGKILLDWWWLKPQVACESNTASEVNITVSYEGGTTYRLYRKTSITDWYLIDERTPTDVYTYTDVELPSGSRFVYAVSIDNNLKSDSIEIEVL